MVSLSEAVDNNCGLYPGYSLSLSSLVAAQSPKPFKTIDLSKVKIAGSGCEIKLQDGLSSLIWLDEQHLAASSFAARCPNALPSSPAATEIAVLDDAGSVQSTARRNDLTYFFAALEEPIAGLGSGKIRSFGCPTAYDANTGVSKQPQVVRDTAAPSSTLDSNSLCVQPPLTRNRSATSTAAGQQQGVVDRIPTNRRYICESLPTGDFTVLGK